MNLTHNLTHGSSYGLTINGDQVTGNYRTQKLTVFGTSVGGWRASSYWAWENHNEGRRAIFVVAFVGLINQCFHLVSFASDRKPSELRIRLATIRHLHPQTNITSMRIHAATDGIGVGSRIRLYRL